jgi:sterol 3beta-glucosyltransferase
LPEGIFKIDSAPHDWLFPRMAAVVHHGGAGTTAAALRAGVPSLAIPFFADQPFWGRMVYDKGVGAKPIIRNKLTVERLSEAIQFAVSQADVRERAAALGARIRGEDGPGCVAQLIEETLGVYVN